MKGFLKLNLGRRGILIILVFMFLVTGCASYKYEVVADPYKGYVVKRNDYIIPEYTTDTKNIAPEDLKIAEARFKRRRDAVTDYYEKMGRVESQFRNIVLDYPLCLVTMVSAVFRLPSIIVSDYRYEHNPKYRARIDKRDEEKDRKEEERIGSLQKSLNRFIENDLRKEPALKNPAKS